MTKKEGPTQTQRLYTLLSDGLPHRTDEIVDRIYGHGLSLARVGARVWDVKHKYNVQVEGWHDSENHALYWYQLKLPGQEALALTS